MVCTQWYTSNNVLLCGKTHLAGAQLGVGLELDVARMLGDFAKAPSHGKVWGDGGWLTSLGAGVAGVWGHGFLLLVVQNTVQDRRVYTHIIAMAAIPVPMPAAMTDRERRMFAQYMRLTDEAGVFTDEEEEPAEAEAEALPIEACWWIYDITNDCVFYCLVVCIIAVAYITEYIVHNPTIVCRYINLGPPCGLVFYDRPSCREALYDRFTPHMNEFTAGLCDYFAGLSKEIIFAIAWCAPMLLGAFAGIICCTIMHLYRCSFIPCVVWSGKKLVCTLMFLAHMLLALLAAILTVLLRGIVLLMDVVHKFIV